MAKKKSLFSIIKHLFTPDSGSRSERKESRRRVPGNVGVRRFASFCYSIPPSEAKTADAEEGLRKPILARKTNCAGDAAAASQISGEGTKLTRFTETTHRCCWEDFQELPAVAISSIAQHPKNHQLVGVVDSMDVAAIKIQSAFRAYLARKALRALKGLVRLQAIIRGRAVRRQAMTTLKYLQSIVNIQSQICASRIRMTDESLNNNNHEGKELILNQKDIKIDPNCERRWDDSLLSREEAKAMFLSKREAIAKRARIKEYSLIHRRSIETEHKKVKERRKYWMEPWVDIQWANREEDLKTSERVSLQTHPRIREEEFEGRELKARNLRERYHRDVLESPLMYISSPRRSFQHKKQNSMGEGYCFVGSPAQPTYMATTESAIAKARSLSSPRLRTMDLEAYSQINSPYKHKLSPISSINSDVMGGSITTTTNNNNTRVCNPRRGSQASAAKSSSRTLSTTAYYSSECPLPHWN